MQYWRSILPFGAIGALVAFCLIAYARLGSSSLGLVELPDWLYVTLCPPSIGLMGVERAGPFGLALAYSFIVVVNAVIYSAIARAIGSLFRRHS